MALSSPAYEILGQGTVNAKITAPDFAAALEKGRKKPALSGRAKNRYGTRLHRWTGTGGQYIWLLLSSRQINFSSFLATVMIAFFSPRLSPWSVGSIL